MDMDGKRTWVEDPHLLRQTFDSLEREHSSRIMLDKLCRRLYFDLPIATDYDPSLPYREFGQFETLQQLGFNLTREVIDASAATVCQRLKATVEPVGADLDTERACLDLSAGVAGVLDIAKFWDRLAPIAHRDGSASSLGTILWYTDGASGEVLGEVIDPLRVYYHYSEGFEPIHLYIDRVVPRVGLMSQFPAHRAAILNLPKYTPDSVVGVDHPGSNGADTVRVLMAWRRAIGGKGGKFLALAAPDLVLAESEWKHAFFPTAHYRYDWDSKGFGGYAGARIIAPYHRASNRILRAVMDGFDGMVPTALYNEMEKDDEFSTVGWRRMFWKTHKPEVFLPNAVSAVQLQQLERLEQKAHFAFGMNQDAAAGTRPAGLNSAPAQREWKEGKNERLSRQIANWAALATESARAIVALASDAYKDKKVRVKAPGTNLWNEIAWPIDLQENKYVTRFEQSSGLSDTLAGAMEELAELRDRGAITEAEYLRLRHSPDVRGELSRINAAANLAITIIMAALNEGKFTMPDVLQGPGVEMIVTLGTQEYQRARMSNRYPRKNVECLRRVIQAADARRKGLTAKPPVMPVPGVLPGQPASVAPMASAVLPPARPLPALPVAPPMPVEPAPAPAGGAL